MNKCAVIFGGTGYIGTWLARRLLEQGWSKIVLADIKPPTERLSRGIEYVACDVRQPITGQLSFDSVDWIFNFAAVHREPGHVFREYFDTNIPGAKNVCSFAETVGCSRILFTSSIAVYGEIAMPTNERTAIYPDTGYGISKCCAELIHRVWQSGSPSRRLIVVRPGVVYGPGDPGNILRMIRAIQRGMFFMPGDGSVRKSYAYIYGLLDSIDFMMGVEESFICYNYVERETEKLSELVHITSEELGISRPRMRIPMAMLVWAARLAQLLSGGNSPIHPLRVRKAAKSTYIVPEELLLRGFEFRYEFRQSLRHWMKVAPSDFGRSMSVSK